MKKIFRTLSALLTIAAVSVSFTSCSDDDDDPFVYRLDLKNAGLSFEGSGQWSGTYTDDDLYVRPFFFNHKGSTDYGGFFSGYTASISTDNKEYDNMLAHQYDVVPGRAASGSGEPFLIGFWNSSETSETPLAERSTAFYYKPVKTGTTIVTFTPQNVKVVNTTYAYYTMLKGNAFARKFEKGDWLKLIAHGVRVDGTEAVPVEFYLADCRGDDQSKWYVTDWTDMNLSALGEVAAVYFTMESSDNGQWGMNTPAYFALCNLEIQTWIGI